MNFLRKSSSRLGQWPEMAAILKPMLLLGALTILLTPVACSQTASTPTQSPTSTATATPMPPTLTSTSTPIQYPTPANWNLIWSDEFNAPDGSGVDTNKWTLADFAASVNAEWEYYTPRIQNVYMNLGAERAYSRAAIFLQLEDLVDGRRNNVAQDLFPAFQREHEVGTSD